MRLVKESEGPEPDVCVVMPVGRVDAYLLPAIRSILDQTGVATQLIIAFDGVDPELPDAVQSDPRVTVLHSPVGQGIARTLNSALAHAGSDVVARMDSDDLALPGRLERQIAYLRRHPEVGAVGSYASVIDGNGANLGVLRGPSSPFLMRLSLQFRNPVVHPSVMFRRSVVARVGGYREEAEGVEDHDLWLRMSRVADVTVLPSVLLEYRRHGGQVTVRRVSEAQYRVLLEAKLAGRSGLSAFRVRTSHGLMMVARRRLGKVESPQRAAATDRSG